MMMGGYFRWKSYGMLSPMSPEILPRVVQKVQVLAQSPGVLPVALFGRCC
jgi:hypothetical protein